MQNKQKRRRLGKVHAKRRQVRKFAREQKRKVARRINRMNNYLDFGGNPNGLWAWVFGKKGEKFR